MANTKIPSVEWNWLDELDEQTDTITVNGGGYSVASNDTITVSNPGAVSGGITLTPGAGGYYQNTVIGTAGPYVFSNGTASITQNPWSTQSTMAAGKMSLVGEDADLVINGRSLNDTLSRLEERLNILNVNERLEAEWEELRELGNQYRKLEEHIKAKMRTYEALKRYDEN